MRIMSTSAAMGRSRVKTPAMNIPPASTHLAPNVEATHPPGIWGAEKRTDSVSASTALAGERTNAECRHLEKEIADEERGK